MNLRQTIEALESNHVQVALDIGVHQNCAIDSNCPVAVKLRKIVNESGVTLPQLIEAFAQGQGENPAQVPIEIPQIDGHIVLHIGSRDIPLDLTPEVRSQIERSYRNRVEEVLTMSGRCRNLGTSLYQTYLHQIDQAKRTRTLPQLQFPIGDLLAYHCVLSTDGSNYLFLFPIEYKPQWLFQNNIRYELGKADVSTLRKDVCLVFSINPQGAFVQIYLVYPNGSKFQHYHGRGGDCWGHVKLPERWDKTIRSLGILSYQLQAALATINADSLMQREIPGWPNVTDLQARATRLGEEGKIEPRPEPEANPQISQEDMFGVDVGNPLNPANNIIVATPRWGGRT